jgi:DNA-directed RNA polymerase subunit RPC12/RpoP
MDLAHSRWRNMVGAKRSAVSSALGLQSTCLAPLSKCLAQRNKSRTGVKATKKRTPGDRRAKPTIVYHSRCQENGIMALIACNECGKEISDKAATCPHCGLKTSFKEASNTTSISQSLKILGIVLVIAFLAFLNFREWIPDNSLERRISRGMDRLSESSGKARKLTAVDVSIKRDQFLRYVTGSITNTSGQKFSYFTVKVNLFDRNGGLVDSTAAFVQDFEPNQTWNFQAAILNDAVNTARVIEIDGF